MLLRSLGVKVLSIIVRILILSLVYVERVGGSVNFLLLVLIVCLEACISYSVGLVLQILTDVGILGENLVLVVVNAFSVCISSLIV